MILLCDFFPQSSSHVPQNAIRLIGKWFYSFIVAYVMKTIVLDEESDTTAGSGFYTIDRNNSQGNEVQNICINCVTRVSGCLPEVASIFREQLSTHGKLIIPS